MPLCAQGKGMLSRFRFLGVADNEAADEHHSHASQDVENDEPRLEAIGRTRVEDCLEVARKVHIGIDPWWDVGGKR